ncbi:hypothetical protein [Pseudonocardia sp. KRD291]|nr:hypothetical protein [Pseudonocardia sp. KRD291]
MLEVLRDDFPGARLVGGVEDLRQSDLGPVQGSRPVALPVILTG